MSSILFQAFVYLIAAVVAVPIAKRIGLGSVLGYLIAGLIIGPFLGLVGAETQDLQHFAEFGVVMMLFLVGLELEPRLLWEMKNRLIGLGGFQVGITTLLIALIAYNFGFAWQTSIAIGFIGALSSTAIVLQTLGEKGLMKTEGGQSSFSVLLFQDIAVIPMLAIVPLLTLPEFAMTPMGDDHGSSHSLVDGLPGWAMALTTLGAIAAVVFGGHYLSRPLFRFIAQSKLREIFTASALMLVIAIALLMELVGLSPALGTFLAGVVLANSEYRHELESDIEPFKGLLLGLFFITVGAGINLDLLTDQFSLIAMLTLGAILLKFSVLLFVGHFMGLPKPASWLMAMGLCQVGEFGFVLINFSLQNHAIPQELASLLSLVVALSMLLTPFLFILYDKVISGRMADDEQEADEIDDQGTVIIAGHGRFGQVINRVLLASGTKTVVLDHQSTLVEGMRKFGMRTFFGDASRPDLLHAAGLHSARMLIIAIDDPERTIEMVKFAKREHPEIHIVARATDRHHVYELFRAGADDIVRETFDSAVRASRYALQGLGEEEENARRITSLYVEHDRKNLLDLARVWEPDMVVADNEEYKSVAKENRELLTEAIQALKGKCGKEQLEE